MEKSEQEVEAGGDGSKGVLYDGGRKSEWERSMQ